MNSREYPKFPLIGIGAIVLGQGKKILMIKRGKPPRINSWSLPGGAQKLGETIDEAAIREVREETGLKVKVVGLVGVVDSIHRDHVGSVQYHYTLVDLLAQPVGGTLAAGGDVVDAKWFEINAVYGMELWSETKRIIRLAVEMAEIISD